MEQIVSGEFFMERFPGKGGWTYIKLPLSIFPSVKSFGMLKVSGSIDSFAFEGKHLMPMGDGSLFIPVAKSIRAILKKEAGDRVHLKLLRDEIPSEAPQELIDCLKDDPGMYQLFQNLSRADQTKWIEYIYGTSSLDAKTKRILKLLFELKTH
jgi:hypothetical protein